MVDLSIALEKNNDGILYPKIRLIVSHSVQKQGFYLHAHNSPHYRCMHTPGNLKQAVGICHIFLVSTTVGLNQPKCEMCSIQQSNQITVQSSMVCDMETMSQKALHKKSLVNICKYEQ